jgi:hypothetical protein
MVLLIRYLTNNYMAINKNLTDEQVNENVQAMRDQGANESHIRSYLSAADKNNLYKPQLTPQEVEAEADTNLGTGFKPSFESQSTDSLGSSALKTVGNVPKSLFTLGKDVVTAVANPIDTAKALGTAIKGAGGKVGEAALEETNVGQSILGKMNEFRANRGIEALPTNEDGVIQAAETPEVQVANAVGTYFEDRYGSLENAKESFVEDPAGVLADIASVVTGAGATVRATGQAGKISTIADAGSAITRAGQALEPTNVIGKAITAPVRAAGNSAPGRMIGESLATPTTIVQGQVVKALDLTQGDLQRISATTGNDVTEFITRNNLLKDTPEEIAFALDDVKANTMALVRNEVSAVDTVYKAAEVPRLQDGMRVILQGVDKVTGLEDEAAEIRRLLQQDDYSLSDVQRAKELIDANSSIYSRMGDVRSSSQAKGLDNVRKDLRAFIEDEVSKATDGATDIKKLNNDVSTSKAISDAIEARATRGQTRASGNVFNGILGFTAASAFSPEVGLAVFVGKKLSETPSFRIALARTLNATPAQDVKRISEAMVSNNLTPEVRASISQIVETAKTNMAPIESASQVVDETNQTIQSQPQ